MPTRDDQDGKNRANAFDLGAEMFGLNVCLMKKTRGEALNSVRKLYALFQVLGFHFDINIPPDPDALSDYRKALFSPGPLDLTSSTSDFLNRRYGHAVAAAFELAFLLHVYKAHDPSFGDGPSKAAESLAAELGVPRELMLAFSKNCSLFLEVREAVISAHSKGSVFIVHGHDHFIRDELVQFVESLNLRARVMAAEAHSGRSLPEKFEDLASDCRFAVFVLTADDEFVDQSSKQLVRRARQNVILEIGYFWGRLGRRSRVAFLVQNGAGMELPTDIAGLGWIAITRDLKETKHALKKEFQDAGLVPS